MSLPAWLHQIRRIAVWAHLISVTARRRWLVEMSFHSYAVSNIMSNEYRRVGSHSGRPVMALANSGCSVVTVWAHSSSSRSSWVGLPSYSSSSVPLCQ
jgi:hypothetical protein